MVVSSLPSCMRLIALLTLVQISMAQNPPARPATFGSTQQLLGNMARTNMNFSDGLEIDVFSPKGRTFVVQQNKQPLDGQFVSGATGEGFKAVLPYSYQIKLNEPAQDLIAQLAIPYNPAAMRAAGMDPANTYVGKLASDGLSWEVVDSMRNVHQRESKTRIVKMTAMDGEYILLVRATPDTSSIWVQYGGGPARTVNITGQGKRQDAEFIDGLRFSVVSSQPFSMNVDIPPLPSGGKVSQGVVPVNPFAWVVTTTARPAPKMARGLLLPSQIKARAPAAAKPTASSTPMPGAASPAPAAVPAPAAGISNATVKFPINAVMVHSALGIATPPVGGVSGLSSNVRLTVAWRAVNDGSAAFVPIAGLSVSTATVTAASDFSPNSGPKMSLSGNSIVVSGMSGVDGQYLLLAQMSKTRTANAEDTATNDKTTLQKQTSSANALKPTSWTYPKLLLFLCASVVLVLTST